MLEIYFRKINFNGFYKCLDKRILFETEVCFKLVCSASQVLNCCEKKIWNLVFILMLVLTSLKIKIKFQIVFST